MKTPEDEQDARRRAGGPRVLMRSPFYDLVDDFRRAAIAHLVAAHGGNRMRTAASLGLNNKYFFALIRRLKPALPPAKNGRPG